VKALIIGISAVAVGFATAASAADLAIKVPTAVAVAPAYNWTGCYIGAAAGGGVQHDTWKDQYGFGAVLGGQLGCNYQTGLLVLGIEGEGFWSSLKTNYNYISAYNPNDSESGSANNLWDADVAARFGLALDRILLFSKIGVAWGGFNLKANSQNGPSTYTYSGNSTLTGMIIGLGAEYAFAPNWTAKAEVDYLGLLNSNVPINYVNTGTSEPYNQTYSAQKVLFKLGVNYKFDLGATGKSPPAVTARW
jgi:outer membrane immunogenic protein